MSTIPHIPGMEVTQPGALDDQPLHILPHTRFQELGVCQGRGDCTCIHPAPASTEAGNVWFAEPEPPEPMTTPDLIAVGALLLVSAASAIGAIGWLWGHWQAIITGA